MQIVPAARWRDWMNATYDRWANRCLPLLMANEAGWFLLNPVAFSATWDGGSACESVVIEYEGSPPPGAECVSSHFGYGIVTWGIPYLFRTPPGVNLLARGPANWPKDGAYALEGLVETDWSVATFTMNWKLTRPGATVVFEEGEPFCMIVPQARGALERFHPAVREFTTDPDLRTRVKEWSDRRQEAHVKKFLAQFGPAAKESQTQWEADYFRGTYPDGESSPEHQTKQRLRPFSRPGAGAGS